MKHIEKIDIKYLHLRGGHSGALEFLAEKFNELFETFNSLLLTNANEISSKLAENKSTPATEQVHNRPVETEWDEEKYEKYKDLVSEFSEWYIKNVDLSDFGTNKMSEWWINMFDSLITTAKAKERKRIEGIIKEELEVHVKIGKPVSLADILERL